MEKRPSIRKDYEKPELRRIKLSLTQMSLATGCYDGTVVPDSLQGCPTETCQG